MGLGSRHGLQQTCALCRGRLTTKEPVQLCSCRHPANHKPGPVVRRQLLGSRITRPLCGGLLLRRFISCLAHSNDLARLLSDLLARCASCRRPFTSPKTEMVQTARNIEIPGERTACSYDDRGAIGRMIQPPSGLPASTPNSSFVRRAGGQIIITTDVENFRVSLNQSKDLY